MMGSQPQKQRAACFIKQPFDAAGSTGFGPAIFGLTGRRVNQATPRPRGKSKQKIANTKQQE